MRLTWRWVVVMAAVHRGTAIVGHAPDTTTTRPSPRCRSTLTAAAPSASLKGKGNAQSRPETATHTGHLGSEKKLMSRFIIVGLIRFSGALVYLHVIEAKMIQNWCEAV